MAKLRNPCDSLSPVRHPRIALILSGSLHATTLWHADPKRSREIQTSKAARPARSPRPLFRPPSAPLSRDQYGSQSGDESRRGNCNAECEMEIEHGTLLPSSRYVPSYTCGGGPLGPEYLTASSSSFQAPASTSSSYPRLLLGFVMRCVCPGCVLSFHLDSDFGRGKF